MQFLVFHGGFVGFFIGLDACKLGVWTGMDQYELSGLTNNYWQFQTGQVF